MDARQKLIVALDVDTAKRALEIVEDLRDSVGMFKVGMQLFTAAGPDLIKQIIAKGGRVFLDLKYHDIPNTVAQASVEATRLGVSIFNVHAAGGNEMMERGAAAVAATAEREGLAPPKVIAVTLLTSANQETLQQMGIDDSTEAVVSRLAQLAAASGLDGVVASAHELKSIRTAVMKPNFLIVTPGMRSSAETGDDQRRTMSVTEAIRNGADYVVVGRPIIQAADRIAAATQIVQDIASALPPKSDLPEPAPAQSVH